MTTFRGCGTALVTPMTGEGAVDLDALDRLVDWQVEQGIDFLVACGSTGEAADARPRTSGCRSSRPWWPELGDGYRSWPAPPARAPRRWSTRSGCWVGSAWTA